MLCIKHSHFNRYWFTYRWKGYRVTNETKPPPPHGYNITKGSAHIAVTREFVRHVLTDRKARDLFDWMSDIKVPDEHFFQTINHSPHIPAPGSFPGTFIFCVCVTIRITVVLLHRVDFNWHHDVFTLYCLV